MVALAGSEVVAVNVVDSLSALRRRSMTLIAAAVAGAGLGIGATFLVSPVWESSVAIELGAVHGEPFEDAATLAQFLSSDAIRGSLPTSNVGTVRVHAVDSPASDGKHNGLSYLQVVTQAPDAAAAAALANQVARYVETRHAKTFEEQTRVDAEYTTTLAQSVAQLGVSIAQIEESIARLSSSNARDNAATVLLGQTQLASQRAERARLSRELKDAKLEAASHMKATHVLGSASQPSVAVWPRKPFFGALGAAIGFVLASISVVARGLFERSQL